MKRILMIGLIWLMLTGFTSPAPSVLQFDHPHSQVYTVLVGWENSTKGIDVESFFPDTLHVHPGDMVKFLLKTNEIHTVTFLNGQTPPDLLIPVPNDPNGAMMINPLAGFPAGLPNGTFDGSAYTNSGIMGPDAGQVQEYDLTFTKAGTYPFMCLVHGMMMSGKIVVDDSSVRIPSPDRVRDMVEHQLDQARANGSRVYYSAQKQLVVPAVQNPDGSTTYTITMGFHQDPVDLMAFFPKWLVVHPGDTVNFEMNTSNDAPHTVTFLNGAADIPFILPVPQPSRPPFLEINPAFAMPYNLGQPLTRTGIFSSGLMLPGMPAYSITIGDIRGPIAYECMLHDASGMNGVLFVTPRDNHRHDP
jgi:plastocyanin